MKTNKTVRNCERQFRFVCPKIWDELKETGRQSERFCEHCEKTVYFCSTDEETLSHASEGHCIAREIPDGSELPWVVLGEPEEPVEHTEQQIQALNWKHREDGIDDSLKNIDAERSCSECGFPAPRWREECRVCGHAFGRVKPDSDD